MNPLEIAGICPECGGYLLVDSIYLATKLVCDTCDYTVVIDL